jgi:hypothetical protein
LALVEINRLLNSNASAEIKNLANLMKEHVATPDFTDFRDSFLLDDILEEPRLYQDCFVIWKGKIANLRHGSDEITFEFLVGYHKEEELQGIVPVSLNFAVALRNGTDLELLARADFSSGDLSLRGVSVHRIR